MRFMTRRYSITLTKTTKPPITVLEVDVAYVTFTHDILGFERSHHFFTIFSCFCVLGTIALAFFAFVGNMFYTHVRSYTYVFVFLFSL